MTTWMADSLSARQCASLWALPSSWTFGEKHPNSRRLEACDDVWKPLRWFTEWMTHLVCLPMSFSTFGDLRVATGSKRTTTVCSYLLAIECRGSVQFNVNRIKVHEMQITAIIHDSRPHTTVAVQAAVHGHAKTVATQVSYLLRHERVHRGAHPSSAC